MFCKKCGKENANGARYCEGCGAQLDSNNVGVNRSSEKKDFLQMIKGIPVKIAVIIIIAIIALVSTIVVYINLSSTINLNKYITIKVDGYNGYGNAEAKIDWDAINKKYGDKIKFTSKAQSEYGGLLQLEKPVNILKSYIHIELDRDEKLKNGDEITYTWEIDSELDDYIDCNIKYEDAEYTVSGLQEIETFDAFSNLKVNYTGVAPNGDIELKYEGSELDESFFECDKSSELDNGDEVTISIDDEKMEDIVERVGKIPEPSSKKLIVSGLDTYVTELDSITDNSIQGMKSEVEKKFNEGVSAGWEKSEEKLKELKYMGCYLLNNKDTEGFWGATNKLYLVYRVKVNNKYKDGKKKYNKDNTYYWYAQYDNVVLNADGNITAEYEPNTPSNSFNIDSKIDYWFSTYQWTYYGFQSLDDLKKEILDDSNDEYDLKENITATE